MTLPEGATVRLIGGEKNGYVLVESEGTKGYLLRSALMIPGESEEDEAPESNVITAREVRDMAMDGRENRRQFAVTLALNLNLPAEKSPVYLEVTSTANLRESASSTSKKLGQLKVGDSVRYLGEAKNSYYRVSDGEQEGYIYAECVDDRAILDDMARSINLRPAAPSVVLPEIASDEGGAAVSLPKSAETKKTADKTEEEKKKARSDAPQLEYRIGSQTGLRSAPDDEFNLLANLPAGSNVRILGQDGDFTMVQYNGLAGYVLSDTIMDSLDYAKISGQAVLFIVTAYCPCKICCGKYSPEVRGGEPHTATGTIPEEGRTIAVDPSVIPYGSLVEIEGMGTYVAEDCGGGIKKNHIDVYFENHEDAKQFGKKRLYVTIMTP
ncbi:MAG: SH3 domain-containing protein [Lachnospiraceae bacterium]|nr:SH3 domain-containing protein [Lachnospiraceae bacterium]